MTDETEQLSEQPNIATMTAAELELHIQQLDQDHRARLKSLRKLMEQQHRARTKSLRALMRARAEEETADARPM